MSHHPDYSVQPSALGEPGDADISPVDLVRTYWKADDEDCFVTLPGGDVVISSKTSASTAATVLADIKAGISAGQATPVTADHLDDLGLRDAVLEWAQSS